MLFTLGTIIHLSLFHDAYSKQSTKTELEQEDQLARELYNLCDTLTQESGYFELHQSISFKDIKTVRPIPPLIIDHKSLEQVRASFKKAFYIKDNIELLGNKSKDELEKMKSELLNGLTTLQLLKTQYYFRQSDLAVIGKEDIKRFLSSILKALISKVISKLTEGSIFEPFSYWIKTYYLWSVLVDGWRVISDSTDAIAFYFVIKNMFTIDDQKNNYNISLNTCYDNN